MKAQKVNPFTTSESQEAMFINNEKPVEEKLPVRRAKWYSDPKIKKQVQIHEPIFAREVRPEEVTKGYHQLLQKIQISNLAKKQVKNGQTIFA